MRAVLIKGYMECTVQPSPGPGMEMPKKYAFVQVMVWSQKVFSP